MRRLLQVLLVLTLTASVAACGSPASNSSPSAPPSGSAHGGSRPSSPAVVRIVEPRQHQQLSGSTVHVVLTLENARIVPQTSTTLRPDEGHLHLYVDNVLVSMNYGLTQDLPVHPGTYVLKAEFVAADHAPFNPRVYSPAVVFTVR
jgi:hypothetical protein